MSLALPPLTASVPAPRRSGEHPGRPPAAVTEDLTCSVSTPATVEQLVGELEAAGGDWPAEQRLRLRSAVAMGITAHGTQTRKSGEPYITHPLSVALIVASLGADPDTVIAAVLHDVVEDTATTLAEIRASFGRQVAGLVDGATKVGGIRGDDPDHLEAARLRKLFLAMADDPRVVVIKLADRLHNLRTIASLPAVKAARIGRETLALHGPLAHRLGLAAVKAELEDRAFAVAHPAEYARIRQVVADAPTLTQALTDAQTDLAEHLAAAGISARVQGRIKHAWSIYRKTQQRQVDAHDVHDLIGLRAIVATEADCYAALGEVHSLWAPTPRVKDYIARPKFNSYRSLHTTVSVGGRLIEVQIRTEEMHAEAEFGTASHHAYKHGPGNEPPWLRRLLDWTVTGDDGEYLAAVTDELGGDEIWVSTPAGDLLPLPAGAVVVDFAYAIHTQVGDQCSGARVNGHPRPLSTRLRAGDVVEVLTNRSDGPNIEWLAYVRTAKARTRIRQHHSRLHRANIRAGGEAALTAMLAKVRVAREDVADWLLASTRQSDWDSLAEMIGTGTADLPKLTRALRAHVEDLTARGALQQPGAGTATSGGLTGASADQVPADGPRTVTTGVEAMTAIAVSLPGLDIQLAGCCSPTRAVALIGIAGRTSGVVGHSEHCPHALDILAEAPGRHVNLRWVPAGTRVTSLHVVCRNRPGMLAAVATSLASAGADVETSASSIGSDGVGLQHYQITHTAVRNDIAKAVRALDGVISVVVE